MARTDIPRALGETRREMNQGGAKIKEKTEEKAAAMAEGAKEMASSALETARETAAICVKKASAALPANWAS